MAEAEPDVMEIPDVEEEEEEYLGHWNINEANKYSQDIDNIIDDFHNLLNEDWKDALPVIIGALKRWISQLWMHMAEADPKVVL